ncbi:recombination protein NinG [Avibacterium sp. 21-594]|uniref:recombination protein NinG n=1 Tax=Avibacterium sp. 21-594 TaxID=2911535 RepID=UPI002246012A|nr:recombination protein NinG [Avibacterium sp. 21-594]MCW9716779.1 recombination protein NinG [Avibacterium sp. 21-594]
MRKKFKLKCKICGECFETYDSFRQWCSPECGVTPLAKQKQAKQREKAEREKVRAEKAKIRTVKERLKTRSQWLKEAQAEFNRYIRLRDKDLPCISCGRFHSGKYDAGHYRSVGSAPELRFHEDNCHKQCVPCNRHKSGNAIDYRINLIGRIGVVRVEFLERKDHPPAKWSVDEIKEIIKTYKEKINVLKARGN